MDFGMIASELDAEDTLDLVGYLLRRFNDGAYDDVSDEALELISQADDLVTKAAKLID